MQGISAGASRNAYRGLVSVAPTAKGARNFSQCDSMLIGDGAAANTYPYIQVMTALGLFPRPWPAYRGSAVNTCLQFA